jgi:hypothetical protein
VALCKDCGVEAGPRRRYCDTHKRQRRLDHWRRHDKTKRPHHGRDRYRKYRAELTDGLVACEICITPFGYERATRPCWDHDHTTGQFRGWLCHRCNVSLGLMADDPVRLRAAADYLERHRG